MRVRWEAWGAWVRTDDPPALVALDRQGMRALGFEPEKPVLRDMPLEVHVAVTSRCSVGCEGCYLDATPQGEHVPTSELLRTIDRVAEAGAFTVAFGGGEPILRDDLDLVAKHAKKRGLVPVLTTSGIGLTPERAKMLRELAQVNISYDGTDDLRPGAAHAERAIALLAGEGVRVGVNIVLTRSSFERLGNTLERARTLGAIEAQLLRYKPAGRAARLDYLDRRLTPDQALAFAPFLRAYVARPKRLRVRIDCALVPFLSADRSIDPERVRRLGILGCEAGSALAAVRSDGRIAPCSFADPCDLGAEDFASFEHDPTLARFRAHAASPPEPCASCLLRHACRGGCKVVTKFLSPQTGGFAPDPECPRVRGLV
jgi:radical SAM protein with 4Fe4S-binding SPASM domain